MLCGINECASILAREKGISKTAAKVMMQDVINTICTAIDTKGGVSFKDAFSIKVKTRSARSGCMNGHEWSSPAKRVLHIKAAAKFDETMNPAT